MSYKKETKRGINSLNFKLIRKLIWGLFIFQIQDEMVERRIKISGLVMAEVVSKAEEEERILKKAEKERDEK